MPFSTFKCHKSPQVAVKKCS